MSKTKQFRKLRNQRRKARRRVASLKRSKLYKTPFNSIFKESRYKVDHDERVIARHSFELENFLNDKGNRTEKEAQREINMPSIFSLEEKYNDSIIVLSLIRKSLLQYNGEDITLNFKNCVKSDFSALLLLKVLLDEYLANLKKLQTKLLIVNVIPIVRIIISDNPEVNVKLLANHIIESIAMTKIDFAPISRLNLIKGSKMQKSYAENKKSTATTKIFNYINEILKTHHTSLNERGVGYLDGLISEILNNAEDHSPFNDWYVFGNLFETIRQSENTTMVGEINLAILNFGYSIFEGFEESKTENHDIYSQMNSLFEKVSSKFQFGKKFTKENMFTLYALQEGISRLKFNQESRGTGTMKFIRSFLDLGDYQDEKKGFIPHLLIFSGETMLKCDNEFKPFEKEGVYYLSLNPENDLTLPPRKTHLKTLDKRFPGTFLVIKIYLNEDHLKKKVKANGHN